MIEFYRLTVTVICFLTFSSTSLKHETEQSIGDGIVNGNYIGGFDRCNIKSPRVFNTPLKRNYTIVRTPEELLTALKLRRKTIYLDDNSIFNLTGHNNIVIPPYTNVLSGRGKDGSKGALIFTDTHDTWPLFVTGGDGVRISGVRIKGPDPFYVNPLILKKLSLSDAEDATLRRKGVDGRAVTYAIKNSKAIEVVHDKALIENCEIFNWSHAGVSVGPGGSAIITHSFLYNNRRRGLGYGVVVHRGSADVIANIFKDNRHAIAGSGDEGTTYEFSSNIILPSDKYMGHHIDMHGGKDRKDGTDRAGDQFLIQRNLIFFEKGPAILIRGMSKLESNVKNNVFVDGKYYNAKEFSPLSVFNILPNDRKSESVIMQTNKSGNLKLENNRTYR